MLPVLSREHFYLEIKSLSILQYALKFNRFKRDDFHQANIIFITPFRISYFIVVTTFALKVACTSNIKIVFW